jgi:hypothetical protein
LSQKNKITTNKLKEKKRTKTNKKQKTKQKTNKQTNKSIKPTNTNGKRLVR